MRAAWLSLILPLTLACSTQDELETRAEPARPDPPAAEPDCPLGSRCDPIPIASLPFTDTRDTTRAPQRTFTRYACAPDTLEGGGEWLYVVDIDEVGLLSATLDDVSGDDVDVDIHLLRAADPDACVTRHDRALAAIVEPGRYVIAADTFTDAEGVDKGGAYQLRVGWVSLGSGDCAMERRDLRMFWPECAPGITCYEGEDPLTGKASRYLRTPATGPVVKEAHLVTEAEAFPEGWPVASRDGIPEHHALSQTASGFEDARNQPWAPAGEGGSRYGQGSTGGPIPVLDEAWYITMYWRDRPPKGTRLIVMNVESGRAVVASAGYETGPGSNAMIAGVTEEIHHHLGTSHGDQLLVGFALDPELPLGPITCE